MAKKASEVVSYFNGLYDGKAVYLWGANGETITEALCDRLLKSYGSKTYDRAYYDAKLREGKGRIGADCSGAFRPMSGFDATAQGYYDKCARKGPAASAPRGQACLVFKGDSARSISHMGMYTGDGYVVEMKSSKDNCVRAKLDGGGWQWYGVPAWIDYSPAPQAAPAEGTFVDASSYQGDIDWAAVRAAGIFGAVLKIMDRGLATDAKFERNWAGCAAAGVEVLGVYNYSYAATPEKARSDAARVAAILAGRKCAVWMDVEDRCQQGLGPGIADVINAYADEIASHGLPFGVYTGMSFYKTHIAPYASSVRCGNWWVARYYRGDRAMRPGEAPDGKYCPSSGIGRDICAWQYTSHGRVPGVSGNVDMSVSYGMPRAAGSQQASPARPAAPSGGVFEPRLGKVATASSVLNVRTAPTTAAPIAGKYAKGELIPLLGKEGGWYRTDKGYVSGEYVRDAEGEVCGCHKLNMRLGPGTRHGVSRVLSAGDRLSLLAKEGGWLRAREAGGAEGYVSARYIRTL